MQDLNHLRLLIAVLRDSGVVSYKDKDVQLTLAQDVRSVYRVGEVHGEQAAAGASQASEPNPGAEASGPLEAGEYRSDDSAPTPTEDGVPQEVKRLNPLYRHPALGLDLEFRHNG